MRKPPFLTIVECLDLTEEDRSRLVAETEVPSLAAALFFRIASVGDVEETVAGLRDDLADLGECVRAFPDIDYVLESKGKIPHEFLWLVMVPVDAREHLESLFQRPAVERFAIATWEDRPALERFFSEIRGEKSADADSFAAAPLDQARSFLLSSGKAAAVRKEVPKIVPGSCRDHKNTVTLPTGFRAAGVRCGIKSSGMDLGLLVSDAPASVAARFTRNRFCAPPVQLSRERVSKGGIRAVVVNSGNANAATGERGMKDALRMTELTAELLGLEPDQVLVCSTGIIGEPLPMEKIETGIREAVSRLSRGEDDLLIQAIMTTDTVNKSATRQISIAGREISLGGIAKGSGMIHPNMATMHVYLTTDAAVERDALDLTLGKVVDRSFNCLSVDGDTSTSDTVLLFANGSAGNEPLTVSCADFSRFEEALLDLCVDLTRQLARDGEGATHLVRVVCEGAATREEAHCVAMSVATSLLVKTAVFGRDPNWGRIIMAVGKTDARFDPMRVRVRMGGLILFEAGEAAAYDAEEMARRLAEEEVEIRIDLGEGDAEAVTVYTCDLSYDYVRINAEYHT